MPARKGPDDSLTELRLRVARREMTVAETDEGLVFEAVAPAPPASEERRRLPLVDAWHEPKPQKRGECESARGVRDDGTANPCPWVSCAWNLALDVERSHIRVVAPSAPDDADELNLDAMPDTCVLDIADRIAWRISRGMNGGLAHEVIGVLMRLSGERVRQIERSAMRKYKQGMRERGLAPDDEGRTFKPRPKTQEEVDDDNEESESPKPVAKPRIMRGTLFDGTAEWAAAERARAQKTARKSEPSRTDAAEPEGTTLTLFGEDKGEW